ncbi:MAG: hypothetical protein WBD83_14285 [Xanthobacteraceae bacterium]
MSSSQLLFAGVSKQASDLVCNVKRDPRPLPWNEHEKGGYFDRLNFKDFPAAILEKLRNPARSNGGASPRAHRADPRLPMNEFWDNMIEAMRFIARRKA